MVEATDFEFGRHVQTVVRTYEPNFKFDRVTKIAFKLLFCKNSLVRNIHLAVNIFPESDYVVIPVCTETGECCWWPPALPGLQQWLCNTSLCWQGQRH